jgi:hypothetical protein
MYLGAMKQAYSPDEAKELEHKAELVCRFFKTYQ